MTEKRINIVDLMIENAKLRGIIKQLKEQLALHYIGGNQSNQTITLSYGHEEPK